MGAVIRYFLLWVGLTMLIVVSGTVVQNWNELRFLGCVAYENLYVSPDGVRTDGLCLAEYLAREGLKETR